MCCAWPASWSSWASDETIVILTAGIDLSIGSVLTFSSVIAALAIKAGVPLPLALAAGLVVGAALGFLNGLMVAVVKLPAFIATYGMMWVAAGFAVVLLKGQVIYGFEDDFRFLGVGQPPGGPHADRHHGRSCGFPPTCSCGTRPSADRCTRWARTRRWPGSRESRRIGH